MIKFYLKWFVVSFEDLNVGAVSDGVMALVDDQEVDLRHGEEMVVQSIQKHLMNHHQNLGSRENFLGKFVRNLKPSR